ncbi:MAG: hypothetical protein RQ753_08925 [Desulfurivibrionaceae bacterium]|nr:hypothetical protein [Desulfobulbales bacterium]MDT8335810.1 hypothetical protein [Desulfurivibrionaceae bacterium]
MSRTVLTILLISLITTTTGINAAEDPGNIVVMPVEYLDKSLEEGASVMEEIIADYFANNHSVLIVSEEQQGALAGADTGSRSQLVRTVTEKMAGDQALILTLQRYRERAGDNYSVKEPASLAFEFKLVNVKDGKTACSGSFDETQESLTDNILNFPRAFRRGFKWITVRQMAGEAVRETFAACPALQGKPGR